MRHRVFWSPNAEAKIEQLLEDAADANEIANAARGIDQILLAAPKDFGESRYDTIRAGFGFPLGVQYEVMDDVRTVIVHDVWRIDGK